ncbi:MAG: non-canonical purine NTP pyrophosphatase [archaeon]
MVLYFITGNEKKFKEIQQIIPEIEKLSLDLPEIQEVDAKKIIEEKLKEAKKHHSGEFIIEDTSLYLECINGLPGPLIKWFLETIGNQGLYNIANALGNKNAEARTIIGYSHGKKIEFFEGSIKGTLVAPKKESFGWDPIFIPSGYSKTFADLGEEKNKISMRRLAAEKLKKFLTNKK